MQKENFSDKFNNLDKESYEKSAQKKLIYERKGAFAKYKEFFLGKVSFFYFLKYEIIITLFSSIPGAFGLFLRKIFFKHLFKRVGKGVVFGKNMTIRHPKKISIGDNVIFDDNVVLDAKGNDNRGIEIKDNVVIGRNTILSCKGGNIYIDEHSNIGANCYIISETEFQIGKYVFVAGNSYLIAGGNHTFENREIPIMFQPSVSKGGVKIEDDVWIGAGAIILDGVKIGKGSIIGAASLVNKSIKDFSIAVGLPAKVIKER